MAPAGHSGPGQADAGDSVPRIQPKHRQGRSNFSVRLLLACASSVRLSPVLMCASIATAINTACIHNCDADIRECVYFVQCNAERAFSRRRRANDSQRIRSSQVVMHQCHQQAYWKQTCWCAGHKADVEVVYTAAVVS